MRKFKRKPIEKKAEEEKKREAERRKAEEEKRKREEEEKLRQKQQQELIESIKLSNATINNEESKLQLDRENLLLRVEKVTDNVKRDALKQAINTGGAIHLKYQKEQTDLKKKIQEYEQLVEKLQRQVDEINTDSEGKELHTKQIQTELEEAQIKIKELQNLIEKKNDASQSQEEEHKQVVDSLSKKIETLQKELKEKQESTNNGKYTLKQVLKDYWIWLLFLVLSLSIPLIYYIDKSNKMESNYEDEQFNVWYYKSILDNISNNVPFPLVITDIETKNSDDNWGHTINSSESNFFPFRITYFGLKEGNSNLLVKFFDNEGKNYTSTKIRLIIEYYQLFDERYEELMDFLCKQGFVCCINDHRGHGKSIIEEKDHGYFYDSTGTYVVEDLHQITNHLKDEYPGLPVFLLGHSMGSLIVRC